MRTEKNGFGRGIYSRDCNAPCEIGGTAGGAGLPCVNGQNDGPDMEEDVSQRLPIAILDGFLADILKPYRIHAKYLRSASITQFCADGGLQNAHPVVTGIGRFSIPQSCYIDDTGHFNAVEFNICFNQLAYVVFGKCIEAGLLHHLWSKRTNVSVDDYKDDQLPRMLIVRIDRMRFLQEMKSEDFVAELKLNKMSQMGSTWFLFTSIAFSDSQGVKAQGSVVLAYRPD